MKAQVLIIRFSSMGDILLTTPVLRCLHKQLEGQVEIHYLTKDVFAPLLSSNPHIHRLHLMKENLPEVLSELKNIPFDYVIDLHNNLRSYRVKRTLKALSFSLNKINLEKWLMVRLKINRLPEKHLVDRYFEAVSALSIHNDGKGLDCYIPPDDEIELSFFPKAFRNGYVAFAIGGAHATKKLPAEKITDICRRIEKPVVLLGGEADKPTGHKVAARCSSRVFNACGLLSVMQSASAIRQAAAVITHDTGMMHIAAALGKDIVSVWGNTIPAFGMYPYLRAGDGNSRIFEVNDLRCRPCSKLGHRKCPKKHFYCMQLQDADAIAAAVNEFSGS